MGEIVDLFNATYREYNVDGVPASGAYRPVKSDIRAIGVAIEAIFSGAWLSPESYGAVGDGVTDDTAAFLAMSAAIAAAGGGAVRMRAGATYLAGKQTEAAGGFRFRGDDVLSGIGLNYFLVDLNGAKIKRKAGMRFGGFDGTNTPTVAMPNYDNAQAAHTGCLIRAEGCDKVAIWNGDLDGNSAAQVVGGGWGDTGYQCVDYGVFIAECDNVIVSNVHARDCLLDGMSYRYTGLTSSSAPKRALFVDCTANHSGRNDFSQVGGNAVRFVDCDFDVPGYAANAGAPGGYVHSAPASGLDVEAEGSVISNPAFETCNFIQGPYGNTAFVTDSGTSSGHMFDKCGFDGLVWINKPGAVLSDCRIFGKFAKLYGGDATTATRLIRCRGGDTPLLGSPNPTGLFVDMGGSGLGVRFEDCSFALARTGLNLRGVRGRDTTFTFSLAPAQLANQQAVVLLDDAFVDIDGFTFIDNLSGYAAGEGLFISTNSGTPTGQRLRNCKIVPSANFWLKWNSWSNGGGGYPRAGRTEGRFDAGETESFPALRLQREANFGGGENEWATLMARSAAPAVGGYKHGSFVLNISAPVGGVASWLLTSANTFQAVGIVGAVQCADVPLAAGANPTKAEFDALIAALKAAKLMA